MRHVLFEKNILTFSRLIGVHFNAIDAIPITNSDG